MIITHNDKFDNSKCLLKYRIVLEVAGEVIGNSHHLCRGVPHGLVAAVKQQEQEYDNNSKNSSTIGVLYHANNKQALHKTNTRGEFIWTVTGKLQSKHRLHLQSADEKTIENSYSPRALRFLLIPLIFIWPMDTGPTRFKP